MVNKRQKVPKSDSLHRFRSVGVAVHGPVLCRIVNSVEDAAHILLRDWPLDDGDQFYVAVKACLDGLHDEMPAADVRAAFVAAAREANLAVFA
ncbi:DUF982 domain-containing protein [Rhizobium sp. LCM 4573]|uniref:DUF982 domain-containing protein n=1 Tax=Rhizobium sp. LCM 4573 TaxID=1848291 RepID=UPI0008D9666C|nr:DUF982 domain-containing protein [Rhizobium sp. LCM 4573]OHV77005.1 hypothetical protein LCM4573_09460 [Rhizobium sp. LCM 4573]